MISGLVTSGDLLLSVFSFGDQLLITALKSVEEVYLSLYIFLLAGENGSVDSIHRSSEKNVELTFE